MDLKKHKTIEDYFNAVKEKKKQIFPNNDAYVTRYKYLSNQLNTWIHPYVVKGGMSADGGYLNDHGPDHIYTVIVRASELIRESQIKITEYEMYILLMAIHIHDVGNILGREGHEINSQKIIEKYGIDAGHDRIEWDCIFEIAEAHGGNPKDKISGLSVDKLLNFKVRKPLLAALLKLADELAEDRSRASRFQLENGIIDKYAEIYHKYSWSLHTTEIDGEARQINLSFDVHENDLCKIFKRKVKKGGKTIIKDVYLIDEIYERTYKTHLERMYCMRFTRPELQINKIRVDIEISTNKKDDRNRTIKKHIVYDIGEVGYPNISPEGLFSVWPILKEHTGKIICQQSTEQCILDVRAIY